MCDMFFRPSRAWGDFTGIPHPRLAPWATIFRPLRGLRGRRRAQLCGFCSFRLHATRGFALRQPNPRQQPSPLGRGCHAPALSSAGA